MRGSRKLSNGKPCLRRLIALDAAYRAGLWSARSFFNYERNLEVKYWSSRVRPTQRVG